MDLLKNHIIIKSPDLLPQNLLLKIIDYYINNDYHCFDYQKESLKEIILAGIQHDKKLFLEINYHYKDIRLTKTIDRSASLIILDCNKDQCVKKILKWFDVLNFYNAQINEELL